MPTKSKQAWLDAKKAAKVAKPPKHRNVRCQDSGRWFDSKLERANHLALERIYGKASVLRQVSFVVVDGPKKVRLIVDHVIVERSFCGDDFPRFRLYDTKGKAPTRDWINKARMLQEKHGLKIVAIGKNLKEIDY